MFKTIVIVNLSILPCFASFAGDSAKAILLNSEASVIVIQNKIERFSKLADKQTEKYLQKVEKVQQKLLSKLKLIDAESAKLLQAADMIPSESLIDYFGKQPKSYSNSYYVPYIDSLTTILKFLNISRVGNQLKCTELLGQIEALKLKLYRIESFKGQLSNKLNCITEYLGRYKSLGKYVSRLNREIYYYGQVIQEYKSMLSNPERLERSILQKVSTLPQFKTFFQKYSQLFTLFTPPSDYGACMVGIQSREVINKLVEERLGSNSTNAQQFLSQQMELGKSELNKIKNNFPEINSTTELPDFRANQIKTKKFTKRLELSNDVQFRRGNQWQPSTANLGLQLGYKLSKKFVAGLGIGYNLGLGNSVRKISLSNEGVNFRSFIDWKIDRNTFLSGVFEHQYQTFEPTTQITSTFQKWSPSFFAGITRKQKISNRLKAQCSLLFDLLYKQKYPASSPFAFRFGYSL